MSGGRYTWQKAAPASRNPRRRRAAGLSGSRPRRWRRLKGTGSASYSGGAAAGEKWNAWDLVFCTRRGTPIRRDNLHVRHWKPLLRRAWLPDIRFHELRHTCATLLLTKGVHPKIVSEMLGHSSVSITLDTYSHVIPGLQEVAALAMEDTLGE